MNHTINPFYTLLSCVPCRSEPSDRAEMVNQLLFGQAYNVLESQGKWVKISSLPDNYDGWIDLRQHESSSTKTNTDNHLVISQNSYLKHSDSEQKILLSPGSRVPGACHGQVGLNGEVYNIHADLGTIDRDGLVATSMSYLNTPYLWGGRSIWGIDCSGFTQVVFSMVGIDLPRDASQQEKIGSSITPEDATEGDLAYFSNDNGAITHVGIVLKESQIIHASGQVRIDILNEKGILVKATGLYSHKLHSIKRI